MLTIFVLFVGLTLATAVIAYWSDNLGKKLGKKRVSLWGLRPRTTATFLTIASSWLIMIFTLGVMLTLFSPLRQALLKFDEVKAQEGELRKSKTQLIGQVGELDGQLKALQAQTQSFRDQVAEATGRLSQTRIDLEKSRAAATNARRERGAAQSDATAARKSAATAKKSQREATRRARDARSNLGKVRGQLNATQQQRENAGQQLKAAQAELAKADAAVAQAEVKVTRAEADVTQADAAVTQAEAKLTQAESKLAQVQNELSRAQTNVKTANSDADAARANAKESKRLAAQADERTAIAREKRTRADRDEIKARGESLRAQGEVVEAKRQVAQLQRRSDELTLANEAAFAANERIGAEADIILSSNIRVAVGRTLVARSFSSNVSFSQANSDLHALFERAAELIVPNLLPGAQLQLAPRVVPAPNFQSGDDKSLVLLQDEEIYNGLAEAISRSQNALSVRLISERNHLEDEPKLYARFIVVPVRLALPTDEKLASAVFDKSVGDARLFSALLQLADVGREVAARSGVTPPLSPEAPDFYAAGANEQIFGALRKIDALDGPARVTIVTTEPISTADQLHVRFDVVPAGTQAPGVLTPGATTARTTKIRALAGRAPA